MTETQLAPPVISEPGVYQIPAEEYHADCVPEGSLSATSAKYLIPPYVPAYYRWLRDNREHKDSFDFGRAAHRIVLEGTAELEDQVVTVVDADDWRTKAAREARDAAREAGKAPVLLKDWERLEQMATMIAAHPVASKIFAGDRGTPEASLFWRSKQHQIWRRTRLDFLPNSVAGRRMILADYKTTAKLPDPGEFRKTAATYGYHMQAAACIEGVRALGLDEDPGFVFVVQSKDPPYLVTVIELTEASLTIGRNLNQQAMRVFARCQQTGEWPGYDPEVHLVDLPSWYMRDHDEIPQED